MKFIYVLCSLMEALKFLSVTLALTSYQIINAETQTYKNFDSKAFTSNNNSSEVIKEKYEVSKNKNNVPLLDETSHKYENTQKTNNAGVDPFKEVSVHSENQNSKQFDGRSLFQNSPLFHIMKKVSEEYRDKPENNDVMVEQLFTMFYHRNHSDDSVKSFYHPLFLARDGLTSAEKLPKTKSIPPTKLDQNKFTSSFEVLPGYTQKEHFEVLEQDNLSNFDKEDSGEYVTENRMMDVKLGSSGQNNDTLHETVKLLPSNRVYYEKNILNSNFSWYVYALCSQDNCELTNNPFETDLFDHGWILHNCTTDGCWKMYPKREVGWVVTALGILIILIYAVLVIFLMMSIVGYCLWVAKRSRSNFKKVESEVQKRKAAEEVQETQHPC